MTTLTRAQIFGLFFYQCLSVFIRGSINQARRGTSTDSQHNPETQPSS